MSALSTIAVPATAIKTIPALIEFIDARTSENDTPTQQVDSTFPVIKPTELTSWGGLDGGLVEALMKRAIFGVLVERDRRTRERQPSTEPAGEARPDAKPPNGKSKSSSGKGVWVNETHLTARSVLSSVWYSVGGQRKNIYVWTLEDYQEWLKAAIAQAEGPQSEVGWAKNSVMLMKRHHAKTTADLPPAALDQVAKFWRLRKYGVAE